MTTELDRPAQVFEQLKRRGPSGTEYWLARDLQGALGYSNWQNFQRVVEKAQEACRASGVNPSNHFIETNRVVATGSGASVSVLDFFLSRYAGYLVAMNGEPSKVEIASAQTYFAVQTRRQEIEDSQTDTQKRILLRERVKNANKKLAGVAMGAGVRRQMFGVFQDAGYRGLYGGLSLADVKSYKGLEPAEELLDRSGRVELAANEFRITQREEKIVRDHVNGEQDAIDAHRAVGAEVRQAIQKIGGVMPEELSPELSIKKIEAAERKARKAISRGAT